MNAHRVLIGCAAAGLLAVAAAAAEDAAMPIAYYDMTALHRADLNDPAQARRAWDTAHLAASVQGIVNRDAPRLFIRFMEQPDDFWFDYCRDRKSVV